MKIKINEPCDADWNKMKIGMISRHCELCVKNVMDFTKMSREEILIYLFKNNNKSTCARMYGGQMDFHHQELEAIIEGTRKQKGNLPFVVMSLVALALLSCDTAGNLDSGSNPVLGKIAPTEMPSDIDSLKQIKADSITQTEIGKLIKSEPRKPTCEPKKVKVEGMVDVLMGDVIATEIGEIETEEMPKSLKTGMLIEMPPRELMGEPEIHIQEKPVEIAEIMPEFVGGMDSLMSYLSRNIIYPKKAKKKGMEGRVFVQFVVEKDGSITHSEILRGVEKSMNEEALRVIKNMPNWIPGKNNGEEVRTKFVIPVRYQLK